MTYHSAFNKLRENSAEIIDGTLNILLKIADNILKDPSNVKYRTLRKDNATIKNKVLAAKGGLDCLSLMGFQENTTSFDMPATVNTSKIIEFKKALSTWNDTKKFKTNSQANYIQGTSNASSSNDCISTINEMVVEKVKLPPLVLTYSNEFLRSLETYSHSVLQYENKSLQERAKKLIPLRELEIDAQTRLRTLQEHVKKSKLEDPELSIQDTLLLALLKWFKDFFKWVDSPICERCGGETSFSHMSTDSKMMAYTNRVELHKCKSCGQFTQFARYNDLNILLETRRGRCGEWANTFTLLCRAMGWDTRFVVCEGDHVWTEVYSETQKRWLHCDPCENICDTPLIYENGWNKEISYVMAYSAEEIQDVTWRYSSKHKEVLKRRTKCSESELLKAICEIRSKKLKDVSTKRREYLTKRTVLEIVEFLSERKPGEEDQKGRTSGASVWRLARKEVSEVSEERKHIWHVNPSDLVCDSITIKYSTSLNRYEYISGNKKVKEVSNWNEGAYEHNQIFRKEEKDWNMVYLARNEGEDYGTISWKIDLSRTMRNLNTVSVYVKYQTFENGIAEIILRSENKSLLLPKGEAPTTTDIFANCKHLTLEASLSGGKGDVAWQHSQLFRQSLSDKTDYPLTITLTFR